MCTEIKLFTGPGTRRWPRFDAADVPFLKEIRSSTGFEIQVQNICRGGALLRTRKRLATGKGIQLTLGLPEREIALTAFVLRSSVSSERTRLRYQAAIAFESPFQALDHLSAQAAGPVALSYVGLPLPPDGPARAVDTGFLRCTVPTAQDAPPYDLFALNNW